ncbi:Aspartate aminotransferase [Mycena indigotica]|uniref:Aspartate aminotransferase n=1 Tax=Mycena indigotica TaxID=2126181 RepID=A0A8H6S9U9_9AGAR|nr:Aspartate aminotransferase [Mycena indigotica]KAF7295027.1 Aspartate aminotransferase [Mycena indigotica]
MARDRLAAMRAQQGGNTGSNSYPTQASGGGGGGGGAGGGGYQSRRAPNPYAQQDDRAYEMSDVRDNSAQSYGTPMNATSGGDSMSAFYTEARLFPLFRTVSAHSTITFNALATFIHGRLTTLMTMRLNVMLPLWMTLSKKPAPSVLLSSAASRHWRNKVVLVVMGKFASNRRVFQLSPYSLPLNVSKTALVKSKFVEAIQTYQTVEQQYRTKYKQRMERQFKIVKPDASPEEVRAVVNDDSGGQIFSQALLNSNRYGESRAAYREVQERHEDIKRIERTLGELAQLFNDMSVLVEQQEETINVIETQAAAVEKDTEAGLQYTEKAVESARGARRKRWICFWICLVLLIIIGVVVGIVVKNQVDNSKKNVTGLTRPYSLPPLHLVPPPFARATPRCHPPIQLYQFTTTMPAKKRCEFHNATEEGTHQCQAAALRIIGECAMCRGKFCGEHRMPEQHQCSNLQDCRQQAFERNKARLEGERTVTAKLATV